MNRRHILAIAVLSMGLVCAASAALWAGEDAARHGFDPANLDRTCKPCEDFFQFANGGWIKNHPIPPDRSSWSSGGILYENIQTELHEILDAAALAKPAAGSNEQKIGDFYASCMDTAAIDAAGVRPLAGEFAAIAAVHDVASLVEQAARLQSRGVGVLFAFASDQDFKDSTRVIGEANQGGLGLPDRDYYTREDEKSKQLRDQYVEHAAKILELAGDPAPKAAAEAKTVLAIETSLAKSSMTNVELRDPEAVYHKMSIADAQALTPNLSWQAYFHAVGSTPLTELNVGQPEFFKTLNAMLTSVSLDDWKTYLRWHLLNSMAFALSDPYVQENFNFKGRILTGAKELRPRWKRCAVATDQNLGEALGQVYAQKYFPPEAKARSLALVHNLIAALRADIPTLTWMSPETQKAAIEKLEAITIKIGYPDKWRDYSRLRIDRSNYAANYLRAQEFEHARDLAKIGKPVDRGEWGITPPTVDAYYNPQLNEIVFPAGILQPPFYDPNQDDAYNYGGFGAVIGHEITHGFDDQGAQFDRFGNLKNWWKPEDLKNFKERGDCIAKQFDAYVVEGDLHMNGKLVEGESIADLGGVTLALAAYEKSIEGKPRENDANGFSAEQRFFLGFARVWQASQRPEVARLQANTDPHPLPRFRVRGPVSNMAEFAAAYGCKQGDAMVREKVCKIW
ncbi:MAG TPA: M13 family metallopeptidase [Candidatus Solibacter sp.]|nr:M13 family metallopeptidase [Candidatus Solibacter sp.]